MTLYEIQWKESAKKELKKLDKQTIVNILQTVEKSANDPYVTGCKVLSRIGDRPIKTRY